MTRDTCATIPTDAANKTKTATTGRLRFIFFLSTGAGVPPPQRELTLMPRLEFPVLGSARHPSAAAAPGAPARHPSAAAAPGAPARHPSAAAALGAPARHPSAAAAPGAPPRHPTPPAPLGPPPRPPAPLP